jgi:outer membrane protein insertion porin family
VEVDSAIFESMGSQPLVFRIAEGKKVRVRRVVFRGAEKLRPDELRKQMSTKTDNWYRSGTFKSQEFELDLEKIAQKYRDEGYLDARVVSHDLTFLEDEPNHLEILIEVEEGERYSAGSVSFRGNDVFDAERLEPLVVLREGEVFREKQLVESRNNLQTLYWDGGYIYSVISPQRNVRPDRTVDVEFQIREGEQARVRQVRIEGNDKTREAVIRRELRVLPGDLFSNTELRNSQADLFRLGFFNNVIPDFEQTPTPDEIDLVFEVEEKQTGQFTMGVGFSQQTRASGFFNIGENNLFGRGQSLQFAWQFGSRRSYLNLSFTEPWFLGTPTLVGVDLYDRFSNAIQDFYDTRVRGFGVRVGRPIPGARYTRASLRYAYNQTTLRNFDPFYVETLDRLERELGAEGVEFQRLDKTQWPQVESGITTSIRRNSTDNPFFPTRGSDANLRHEINGGPFGGDLDYQRILVDYDWYLSLPWKLAFHVGASSGHLMAYGNTRQVPDYVRFRLGGNRFFKLRGYGDLDIVPRGNPRFVGGRFYTTITTELAYPITRAVAVLGFVDQGDTWNSFDEADLTNLRTGAGFGIRLEVPLVGRIGLDYGYGFDQANPGWELHFNFGQFF